MTEDIHRTGIERELPCKLTNEQLLETAISKANAEAHRDELEAKLEDLKREKTTEIKEVEKRIDAMGAELRTRERKQLVECYERWRDGATLEIVRSDTREVIDVRVATARDKQQPLPSGDEPADAAAQTGFPEDDEDDADDEEPAPKSKGKRSRKAASYGVQ